jgi:Zn-finger nucleic acid-binding protein
MMNCPVCNVALQMMERQNVEIDYCPQCRGIWLDRGELDKIIERTAAEMPPKTIPQGYNAHSVRRDDEHDDKQYDDHYGGQRKKRSFLHDLFD